MKGESQNAYEKIRSLPWVIGANVVHVNSQTTFEISVSDEERAEDELPKLILQSGNLVLEEFAKKHLELEDIFVQMVEGDKNAA